MHTPNTSNFIQTPQLLPSWHYNGKAWKGYNDESISVATIVTIIYTIMCIIIERYYNISSCLVSGSSIYSQCIGILFTIFGWTIFVKFWKYLCLFLKVFSLLLFILYNNIVIYFSSHLFLTFYHFFPIFILHHFTTMNSKKLRR